MSQKRKREASGVLVMLLVTALHLPLTATARPADVILEWNQVAQRYAAGPPFVQARTHAMVHVAMADAVLAIHKKYEPFAVDITAPANSNAQAAAAQAAHDVLTALLPAQAAAFDAALLQSLKKIPQSERWPGRAVGARVADAVLAWRASDGYADANPQPPLILESELPGIWRMTASGPAVFSNIGIVTPFGLPTPTLFLPAPPPQLESAEYAEDYNDVLMLGRTEGSTRTDDQTRLAQLIANAPGQYVNVTNPLRIWHNVVADTARSQRLSLPDTARLFALVMASVHDSLLTSQTSKFIYRLWRPETAIAAAGIDGNDATAPDSEFTPLLSTPPYPSHSSNAACIGTSAARTLANVLGADDIAFTATWYSSNDDPQVVSTQPYDSFSAFARDFGSSRVWGGIHYRFEIDASDHSCTQVADYIFDHFMGPTR